MIYFRNDDVSVSTDISQLCSIYSYIVTKIPDAHFISCVTLLGEKNDNGSVYETVPFKAKPKKFFLDKVTGFFKPNRIWYEDRHEIASHGLLHLNHANLSRDAQEISIVSSCALLGSNKFVAPFNAYNENTLNICKEYDIEMTTHEYDWKSLEHEPFNPDHKYWYFHSWRFGIKEMKEALNEVGSRNW